MPKSKPHGKHFIRSVLLDAFDKEQKLKFIDFGVGRGTYSNLLRDVFPESSWTGVEIYEPYIDQFNLEEKYDEVININMLEIDPTLLDFDIAFLGDVLEHCTKNEAIQFLGMIERHIPLLIISLPLGYRPQGEFEGNPYEVHKKDNWLHDEALLAFDSCILSYVEENTGVYFLCYGQQEIESKIIYAVLGIQQQEEFNGVIEVNDRSFFSKKSRFLKSRIIYLLSRIARPLKKGIEKIICVK